MKSIIYHTGDLLMGTGALHLLVGLKAFHAPLAAIARGGLFNSVRGAQDRRLAVWFMVAGLAILQLGGLARWTQHRTGTLPAFVGWGLLSTAGLGLLLMPRSGFWALLPPAVLALLGSRQTPFATASLRVVEG